MTSAALRVANIIDDVGANDELAAPRNGSGAAAQLHRDIKWRALGDSNPCYRRERAVS